MSKIKVLGAGDYEAIGDVFAESLDNAVVDVVVDVDRDSFVAIAENEIFKQFGDTVSVFEKGKGIFKYGGRKSLSTGIETELWGGTNTFETYVTTNIIDRISSSNAGNTQLVRVEGHTIDGEGNFTFVVQFVTLAGQTPVVLVTPLARVSRVKNVGSVDFVAGSVQYVWESTSAVVAGVPTDKTKEHMAVLASGNKSRKCSTTFSQDDYGLLVSVVVSQIGNRNALVIFRLYIRNKGSVFTVEFEVGEPGQYNWTPYLIIPTNSDIFMTAEADGNGVEVSGSIETLVAIKV